MVTEANPVARLALINTDYRVGELVFGNGKPREVCTSAAMREGWDDAYQTCACAAIETR